MPRPTYQTVVDALKDGDGTILPAQMASGYNPDASPYSLPVEAADPATWTVSNTSGMNVAITLTRPAEPGKIQVVTNLIVTYDGSGATTLVTLESPDNTVILRAHCRNTLLLQFPKGVRGASGQAVVLEVPAGGLNVVSAATLVGYTI